MPAFEYFAGCKISFASAPIKCKLYLSINNGNVKGNIGLFYTIYMHGFCI